MLPGYVVRELPVEEWPRLLEMPGPYQEQGVLPNPQANRVLVIEQGDTILGYWGAFTLVHSEPVFIREEHRHRVSVVRALWEGMRDLLVAMKVPGCVAIILDPDAPINLPMATKLGFVKVPGSLYYLDLRGSVEASAAPPMPTLVEELL